MYTGSTGNNSMLLKMMSGEINSCQTKIDETERSIKESEALRVRLDLSNKNQKVVNDTITYLKDKTKKLIAYNAKRKERSMSSIYSGIYSAKNIIPDTTPVALSVERESAGLVNDKGDDVNLVEGSAFRATLSFFTRSIILRNTEYMQSLVLDEPLTTLSAESSAALSAYLPILSKEMQIVLIEQKNEIFTTTDEVVYIFAKSEGKTKVRRGDAVA